MTSCERNIIKEMVETAYVDCSDTSKEDYCAYFVGLLDVIKAKGYLRPLRALVMYVECRFYNVKQIVQELDLDIENSPKCFNK